MLSEFFQSVYTSEPAGDVPTLPTVIGDTIDDFTFTKEDVEEKLNILSGDKCPGPDQFHPRVLRECSKELSLLLYLIFRKTLDSGSLPADWKTARVTPIFKKGSKTKPGILQASESNLYPLQDHGGSHQGQNSRARR